MAKFRLDPNAPGYVFTIGGTAVGCPTDVNYSINHSSVDSQCENVGGYIQGVTGPKDATFTVSGELDTDSDDTLLTALEVGGELILTPTTGASTYGGQLIPNGEVATLTMGSTALAAFSANYRINDPTRTGSDA